MKDPNARLLLISAMAFAVFSVSPLQAAGGGGGGGGGGAPSQSAPSYDPAVEYQKGKDAFKAGDFKTAAGHFKKVVAAAPKEGAAHYLLGASYLGMGDAKKAVKPLQLAVKYDPNLIEAHRDLGISYAKIGKPGEASKRIEAIRARQQICEPSACWDPAKTADAIAKIEAAIAAGTQASVVAPAIKLGDARSADETYVTAVSLINEKRYEEAIAYLNEARWAAGPHPDILTYLGFANRKLGHFDVAEGYYQAALDIFPEHRGALEYYGELKLERGNVAGAKAHLAKLEAICGFGCNEADELRRWIVEKAPSAS